MTNPPPPKPFSLKSKQTRSWCLVLIFKWNGKRQTKNIRSPFCPNQFLAASYFLFLGGRGGLDNTSNLQISINQILKCCDDAHRGGKNKFLSRGFFFKYIGGLHQQMTLPTEIVRVQQIKAYLMDCFVLCLVGYISFIIIFSVMGYLNHIFLL